MKFKRKEDAWKKAGLLFIDQLNKIEIFQKLIEQGNEETIQNGTEEVKILQIDIADAPFPYYSEFIKYTITGNLKQLKKLVQQELIKTEDIYDLRGFRVKAYD